MDNIVAPYSGESIDRRVGIGVRYGFGQTRSIVSMHIRRVNGKLNGFYAPLPVSRSQ